MYQKFVYNTVFLLAMLTGAFIGTRWGISGVAAGVVSATAVAYVLMSRLTLRLTQTGWRPFLAAQRPAVVLSCAAAATAIPTAGLLRASGFGPLIVLIGTGGIGTSAALAAALSVPDTWLSPSVRESIRNARTRLMDGIGRIGGRGRMIGMGGKGRIGGRGRKGVVALAEMDGAV